MRTSILDDEVYGAQRRDELAELLADARPRAVIAEHFGVSVDTITEWRKREDIQVRVNRLTRDRANRILSHTDSRIMGKLESGAEVPMKDLLEIRRTYAGAAPPDAPGDKAAAAAELLKALHSDPELAARFAATMSGDADPD